MLYSVVICDLVFKLQHLRDIYSDNKANDILEQMQKDKNRNEKYSKIEVDLINSIKERTSLLEQQDIHNLEYLKNIRDLSAHPVLNELNSLAMPNKDQVRAHITNMLDGILCKSPLLSNNIIPTFLEDAKRIKDILPTNIEKEQFIKKKYLSNLSQAMKIKFFKDIWKFTFRLSDDDSTEVRKVLYITVDLMFRENKQLLEDKIEIGRAHV